MATNTIIGTGVLAAALSAVVGAVLPAPPAIEVHRLEWQDGRVIQDRTVTGEGEAFYMAWAAGVFDTQGRAVPWCEGSGAFAYSLGRHEVVFDLPRWTGRSECTPDSLPAGEYVLRATWSWGDEQASAESAAFEVTG